MDLLLQMLEKDPKMRISAKEALEHEFFSTAVLKEDITENVSVTASDDFSKYATKQMLSSRDNTTASPTLSPRSPLRIPLADSMSGPNSISINQVPAGAIVDEQQTLVLSDCDSPLHARLPIINGRTNTIYIPTGPLITSKNNLQAEMNSPKTSKSSKFSEITPKNSDWSEFANMSPTAMNDRLHIKRLTRAQCGGSEFLKRALLNKTRNFDEGEYSPSQSGTMMGKEGLSPVGGDGYETSDSDANYINSCEGSPARSTSPHDPTSISSPINASAYRQKLDTFSLRVKEITETRASEQTFKELLARQIPTRISEDCKENSQTRKKYIKTYKITSREDIVSSNQKGLNPLLFLYFIRLEIIDFQLRLTLLQLFVWKIAATDDQHEMTSNTWRSLCHSHTSHRRAPVFNYFLASAFINFPLQICHQYVVFALGSEFFISFSPFYVIYIFFFVPPIIISHYFYYDYSYQIIHSIIYSYTYLHLA
eukprot:TRINITY_DN5082_c0_g1_i5.p1 TRINITY_DN5082_c0_g1~~TRINITY_DN5082_c0_g1_i5.p1  ORF type:complete len:481 (+),score=44.45 TRINITY_DN5082_c0_g1_i5:436-1878(+)